MAGTSDNPIIYPPLEMPPNVVRTQITVWCLGLALDADIYRPTDAAPGPLPGVVLSHGIGGDKLTSERYAAKFASSGMVAVAFSQTSWGNSDGRMMLVDRDADRHADGSMTARVQMAKELIDPLDWIDCYRAVLDYLEGEPGVDPDRLGAWGTSFGGGTAMSIAATDSRIKALAVQVPAVFELPDEITQPGRVRARQIARGEFNALGLGGDTLPGVPGTPHLARMVQYLVGQQAQHLRVPTLILDAGDEELFNTDDSGRRAHEILNANDVENYYEVIPGIDHYGIYFDGYDRGSQLANDWLIRHL